MDYSSSSAGPGGDDRWKLSKKGRSRSGRPHAMDASAGSVSSGRSSGTSTSTGAGAAGTGTGSSSSSSSYSAAAASSSSSQQQQAAAAAESSSSSRLSKKCVSAVKEHRARFYIVRRCVSMLVCWRDY